MLPLDKGNICPFLALAGQRVCFCHPSPPEVSPPSTILVPVNKSVNTQPGLLQETQTVLGKSQRWAQPQSLASLSTPTPTRARHPFSPSGVGPGGKYPLRAQNTTVWGVQNIPQNFLMETWNVNMAMASARSICFPRLMLGFYQNKRNWECSCPAGS